MSHVCATPSPYLLNWYDHRSHAIAGEYKNHEAPLFAIFSITLHPVPVRSKYLPHHNLPLSWETILLHTCNKTCKIMGDFRFQQVLQKIHVFWNLTLRFCVNRFRRFERPYCLYIRCQAVQVGCLTLKLERYLDYIHTEKTSGHRTKLKTGEGVEKAYPFYRGSITSVGQFSLPASRVATITKFLSRVYGEKRLPQRTFK